MFVICCVFHMSCLSAEMPNDIFCNRSFNIHFFQNLGWGREKGGGPGERGEQNNNLPNMHLVIGTNAVEKPMTYNFLSYELKAKPQ